MLCALGTPYYWKKPPEHAWGTAWNFKHKVLVHVLASNGGNYSSTYKHCAPESRFWKLQNIPTDEQKTASLFEMEMEMGAAFQSGRKPLGRAWIMSADDCSHAISSVPMRGTGNFVSVQSPAVSQSI